MNIVMNPSSEELVKTFDMPEKFVSHVGTFCSTHQEKCVHTSGEMSPYIGTCDTKCPDAWTDSSRRVGGGQLKK